MALRLRRIFFKNTLKIVRLAARKLADNDVFRMAGATAFFTTFALPPMLMIIVRILSLFSSPRSVGHALMNPLRKLFGDDNAASILQTIRSFRSLQHNYIVAAGIFLFLLFVATTLFKIIRNAINQLWGIRVARGQHFAVILRSRAISVAVILAGGILFLLVQLADAGQHLLGGYIGENWKGLASWGGHILDSAVVMLISSVWFFLLFRFLPDGKPDNRIAVGGAFLTGILFTAGKAVLSVLLRPVQVTDFYGVSGAFALVLLFMFYSALFLYAGAALVAAWSTVSHCPIAAKSHAEPYHLATDEMAAD